MNWINLLNEILPILIKAIITIAIPLTFSLIRSKVKNTTVINLITQAELLAINCVNTVEQTMVIPMKNSGVWNAKAAAEAFEVCKTELLSNLSEATIEAIKTVYNDIDAWAKSQIEAQVLTLRIEEA